MKLKSSLLVLGLAVLLSSDGMGAQPGDAPCCLPTTSLMNTQLNPPSGGDERFFTSETAGANVMFLVSNNEKLQQYPIRLPNGDGSCGCDDTASNAAMSWFDLSMGTTDFDDIGYTNGSRWFNPDRYYISNSLQIPLNNTYGLKDDFSSVVDFDRDGVCARTVQNMGVSTTSGSYTDLVNKCKSCLSRKGWFRGYPNGNVNTTGYWWALDGQVLNVRPPKFVTVRRTMKKVIALPSNVRRGVMTYGPDNGNYDPAQVLAYDGKPLRGSSCTTKGCAPATDLWPRYTSNNGCATETPTPEDLDRFYQAINLMTFKHNENAIAEALYTIGGYFSSGKSWWESKWGNYPGTPASPDGWPGGGGSKNWRDSTMFVPSSSNTYQIRFEGQSYTGRDNTGSSGASVVVPHPRTFCSACQLSTVILISDGMSYADNSVPAYQMLRDLGVDTTAGINYCDEFGVSKTDCDRSTQTEREGNHAGNRHFADDVAYWLANSDLRGANGDFGGTQSVFTYTIGFNVDPVETAFLKSVAKAGKGKFYSADDADGLAAAVLSALDDVNQRSIAVSSASVSQVQSNGSGAALVPRMSPTSGDNWKGELYRFKLYNEFVERDLSRPDNAHADNQPDFDGDPKYVKPPGCLPGNCQACTPPLGPTCMENPNFWTETYLVDADGDVVVEDGNGRFMKRGSDGNPTGIPANPVWEAGAVLRARSAGWNSPASSTLGTGGRKILTAIDTNGDGRITAADGLTAFEEGNLATLAPYLGLTPFFCTNTLPNRLGLTLAQIQNTTTGFGLDLNDLEECAKLLIQFVRGRDIFDSDGDGSRSDMRPAVLGDMFHSSPVVVEPPIDRFLCELGLHNQCMRTLFSQELGVPATPLELYDDGAGSKRDAYDEFREATGGSCGSVPCQQRRKIVVVGSNDGMLHAFDGGTGSLDPNGNVQYGDGTGQELWAFIPPDLLPKLQLLLDRATHHYFVDGDIMVRDVWADLDNDNKKQANEFRTMLVGAEGRGGNHYFALDITNPTDPQFRWFYPEPCTVEAGEFGFTYYALNPKPPPIGPVLIKDSAGLDRGHGVNSREQWSVWLSGGYDPNSTRGRGVYAVDVYSGSLIWKFSVDESSAVKKELGYSIAAPVALVDYGSNTTPKADGFFDTAVVGDTGGQVWLLRMHAPGALTGGVVTNWSGARVFEQQRDGVTTTTPDPGDTDTNAKSIGSKNPFFYIASVGIQPDNSAMRVFLGTGDRSNLKDRDHGQCRLENPSACAKWGCGDMKTELTLDTRDFKLVKGESHWGNGIYKHSKWNTAAGNGQACTSMTGTIKTELKSCPTSVNPGVIKEISVDCAAGVCTPTVSAHLDKNFGEGHNWTVPSTVGNNRYYGFWAYGAGKGFDETVNPTATGGAKTFDDNRLTDTDLVDVTLTKYVDTGGGVYALDPAHPPATDKDHGWFLDYRDPSETASVERSERTASGSALIGSCVLWNTINPVGAVPSNTCGEVGDNNAFFYQADFITGAPNCAESLKVNGVFVRNQKRTVITPPPEPATVVQISKTGKLRYSSMVLEPGKDSATQVNVDLGKDILQLMYQTEVSRESHLCRHEDRQYCR